MKVFTSTMEKKEGDYSRPRVRVHNMHIDSKKRDKSLFFRRKPLKITNATTKEWAIADCLGSGGVKGLNKSTLAIEYDTADLLGIRIGKPCELQVQHATYLDMLRWFWKHPDYTNRMANQHMILGTFLALVGMISLIL
ncbi:hypothetical protein THF1C08_50211 [Vibrio jasicida]|uniref:Uncharacterized protein n=2 Tax=Vibrio harveyi group TaxID=717610 RepID=A0AAU9QTA9_9VIBR|nr:hypothetical protein THF1C08_50211 [Vibrio jasicida]CAH1601623.1 hypothetical protein THF1A12_50135 [Vibrio jasicida]